MLVLFCFIFVILGGINAETTATTTACTACGMSVRIDLDPALDPDVQPTFVSGTADCGSVERLSSHSFEFHFSSFDCDAITTYGRAAYVSFRVASGSRSKFVQASCALSVQDDNNKRNESQQSSKVRVQADVGDGFIRARVYGPDNQLLTLPVPLGTDLNLKVEMLPRAQSVWSALSVDSVMAHSTKMNATLALVENQCVNNNELINPPTFAANHVTFPFKAFRFVGDDVIELEIGVRLCNSVESCKVECFFTSRHRRSSSWSSSSIDSLTLRISVSSAKGAVKISSQKFEISNGSEAKHNLMILFVSLLAISSFV